MTSLKSEKKQIGKKVRAKNNESENSICIVTYYEK